MKWAEALYGTHPYARPDEGTEKSLAMITADDLRAYHKAVFARDNLHVAIVGAIDAETVKQELDRLFGDLPEKSGLQPVEKVDLKLGQEVRVDYDLPQTSLQLAYPGVPRDAPDFFAAYLMNHILGGGTFTSRLFDEVREKRGLAYGVNSSLVTYEYSSGLVISTATRSDRAAETLAVIRDTVRRMAEEGPTEAELAAAKKYIIGSYALNNLDSSNAIAATLLSLQEEELGIDYMDGGAGAHRGGHARRSEGRRQKAADGRAGNPGDRTAPGGRKQGVTAGAPARAEPTFAVAFGGGGARGLAHIHAIEALDELGIRPVAIAGTSIGAIMGAGMAAGMTGKHIEDYARSILSRRAELIGRMWSARPGSLTEMVGGLRVSQFNIERILHAFLPHQIPKHFEELGIPLQVTATDYFGHH